MKKVTLIKFLVLTLGMLTLLAGSSPIKKIDGPGKSKGDFARIDGPGKMQKVLAKIDGPGKSQKVLAKIDGPGKQVPKSIA